MTKRKVPDWARQPTPEECFRHLDENCDICPYYEYEVEHERGVNKGRFWVGQKVRLTWGPFGDGMTLTPKNQGQKLN